MRIAYVINSLEGGGAAFPVPAVTGVFREAGHEVAVFALARKDGLAEAPMRAAGLDVHTCMSGLRDHFGAYRWLYGELIAWQPTHLWTSLTRATLLGQQVARALHIPVASWQHSARLKPANRLLLRSTRSLSKFWVCDSQFVAEATKRSLGLTSDRLACWPIFCADPDTPQATPWRAGDTLHIGSLGRLHAVKGYAELIDAVARLPLQSMPPFDVTITGEGAARADLEARVAHHGLQGRIHLPGFTADTAAFLQSLHLYLQPSRWEGFCIAAHEAMQAGLPVIGSKVGEMTYSITDGINGWHAPPNAPNALSAIIAHALFHPERLHAMGQAARNTVLQRYSNEQFNHIGHKLLKRLED